MGWNGSGTFSRVHDWAADAAGAIDIEAARMDAEDDSFEAGIHNCIAKDGQNTPTANLPMGTNRHTGVGNAAALTDYASAADVIDQHLTYYVDSGSADTYAITPSPSIGAYAEGQKLVFRAANANTGASTLAVNGLTPTAIQTNKGSALTAGMIAAGGYYEVTYDANGSRFVLTSPHSADIPVADGGTGASTAGDARTNLGLGTISTQASSSVSITGGSISGITDLAVADGGTGASTAEDARTNLGLVIGTNVQAQDAHLQDLAALSAVSGADTIMVSTGAGTWALESGDTMRTSLGLAIGTNVQAQNAHLQDLAALSAVSAADNIMVSTGAGTWALESGATARTSLGVPATSITMTAGNGLTAGSGGDLSANRTFAVGAGNGITVNTNDVALASSAGGAGLTYTSGVLAVGAGNGITVNADDVALADAAASTTNPVDISTGTVSLDVEALTTIEGSALAATDTFYVEDAGVSKGIEVQAMGLRAQTGQGTQNLAAADMNSIMEFTATSTLTLPANATTDLPVGVPVVLNMKHATQELTVTAASGVTLVSIYHPGGAAAASDVVIAGGTALLFKTATDSWCLTGDTKDA